MCKVRFPVFYLLQILLTIDRCGLLIASTTSALSKQPPVNVTIQNILNEIERWQQEFAESPRSTRRPFVTVTFAQSLDGKLAPFVQDDEGKRSMTTTSNYPLSGEESLLLTHAMRSIHDGILIGSKTLVLDNPRLTNRKWQRTETRSPRPIILDTDLRYLRQLGTKCRIQHPIICCGPKAAATACRENLPTKAQLLVCNCSSDGRLYLKDVLLQLRQQHGIRTLMVEGGPELLSSFLLGQFVDGLCITIVPKMLLSGKGISLSKGMETNEEVNRIVDWSLMSPQFLSMGIDTALVSRAQDFCR